MLVMMIGRQLQLKRLDSLGVDSVIVRRSQSHHGKREEDVGLVTTHAHSCNNPMFNDTLKNKSRVVDIVTVDGGVICAFFLRPST